MQATRGTIDREMPTSILYRTPVGEMRTGDCLDYLEHECEPGTVDLIVTSPPFPLEDQKRSGGYSAPWKTEDDYLEWTARLARAMRRVLKHEGSVIYETGSAWVKGEPRVKTWQWRIPFVFGENGLLLVQDLWVEYRNRPASPTEWVGRRKIRFRPVITPLWWFSPTPWPKTRLDRVMEPSNARHLPLYTSQPAPPAEERILYRPGGHHFRASFDHTRYEKRIPSNLIRVTVTTSTRYMQEARKQGRTIHPARFHPDLVRWVVTWASDPGDLVLDPMAGINTTGYVAQSLGRRWVSIEISPIFAADSTLWFNPKEVSFATE